MGDFGAILAKILSFYKLPMNIYGLIFSYWDIYLWSILIMLLAAFIVEIVSSSTGGQNSKKH